MVVLDVVHSTLIGTGSKGCPQGTAFDDIEEVVSSLRERFELEEGGVRPL